MFTNKTLVFLFALLLLTVFFSSSYRSQEDPIDPGPEMSAAEDMLSSEGGFDGEYGNTWFPRSEFGGQPGGGLTGWPAKGGYYSIHCSVAELNFLGVDLFKPTNRSDDPQEEEAWCAKMRQVGANWYQDPYAETEEASHRASLGSNAPRLYLGWPIDGGVWALQATKFQSTWKGLGRIDNVFTMEERWRKIKEFGGTFYAEPKDCPYLDLDGSKEPSGRPIPICTP